MPIDDSYRLIPVQNRELVRRLNLDPIFNAHSIYVCLQTPDDHSLAAVSKSTGAIDAILITGQPDIFLLQGYWFTATNPLAVRAILEEFHPESECSINYPIWAETILCQKFPHSVPEIDNLYIYRPSIPLKDHPAIPLISIGHAHSARRLTESLYTRLSNTDRFRNQLLFSDLRPEFTFYCITNEDKLCAIGEHILETDSVCVISQMFTLEEYRGRGYAVDIARALTQSILSRNKIPVAFFSESNHASKCVFEKCGYVLQTRLGYMLATACRAGRFR